MAELAPIAIGSHSYQVRSPAVSLERLVNWYLEANPETSPGPASLYPTPGLTLWKQAATSGGCRGMHAALGALWTVIGSKLYRVSTSKVVTEIGAVGGAGDVRMTDNGTHVAVCTNGPAYAATATSITALPESNLNGATYQDGYAIFTQQGTQNFWLSGLDDLTTISALDFSQPDAFPDNVMGCVSNRRELILFGEGTTEVWVNDGAAAFPFSRAGGGFIQRGCLASNSIAVLNDVPYWVGDDRRVYRLNGYQAEAVSTAPIDRLIEAAGAPSSASAIAYTQDGHSFYCLNFSDLTIVFDVTTGRWHERKSSDENRWRANHYAFFDGKHLVGDFESGDVYELDLTSYTDNGTYVRRESTFPPVHAQTKRAFAHELRVDVQGGQGLTSGQGSDPQWLLDWSDDYGVTWSIPQSVSGGKIGEYDQEVRWHRLGSFARSRTFRLSITDPVNAVVVGAYARLEGASA